MAGLEQLTIHSRSYLVRWIEVAAGHTISWSLQPHKRSINFGIFKHPGSPTGAVNTLPASQSIGEGQSSAAILEATHINNNRHPSVSSNTPPVSAARQDAAPAIDKLQSLGMKSVAWTGRCEADIVSMGHYDVPAGESGMYGLVFDNTHSKQLSKTVTFVLMTYPSSVPPKSGHQIHFKQAMTRKSSTSLAQTSPSLGPMADSTESLPNAVNPTKITLAEHRPATGVATDMDVVEDPTFYTGVLSKKRRKRNQGWAKRFFSLDFTSSTLSYYKNRSSAALRGAIPLSLAAIGADEKSRHISVDSGAEIWLLRASNSKDFEGWRQALEKACQYSATPDQDVGSQESAGRPAAERLELSQLAQIEPLVGRVAGITDAVRRLAKDTDPKHAEGHGASDAKDTPTSLSPSPSPSENEANDYFGSKSMPPPPRPAFWKRKSSSTTHTASTVTPRQASTTQKDAKSNLAVPSPTYASLKVAKRPSNANSLHLNEDVHGRCAAILRDLDSVVAQFSSLIADSRQIRLPERPKPVGRKSLESTYSQEFYDADDGLHHSQSQLLRIHDDSDAEASPDRDGDSMAGDSASSFDDADGTAESFVRQSYDGDEQGVIPKPQNLAPLPREHVKRRTTIPPSSGTPPSLISFLRKNVGKDLSTIAMPVTANEPLSLLQRQSEQMEYSELLDGAVGASADSGERLLYVTAFAISALSGSRAKERAIRKPFNPMLGETYELVREDKGFRFLAEKISHRPVRVACQAEAKEWTFLHAPSPSQKFWGKSAELITEGRARLFLHGTGECFSWSPATCFLRNIIAGEKYVEPVQNMTVLDENSGRKAIATFKSGGVFSGRSEEVSVQAFDGSGALLPLGLQGKWTSHLTLTSSSHGHAVGTGTEVWTAGPLVPDPNKRYGMTEFAASLNEITAMEEEGKALPPTDSRWRPDQRKYEEGGVDAAEKLKGQLEEAQRRRRKEMEASGEQWEPRWFEKAGREGLEDMWRLKGEAHGDDYWGVRAAVMGFKQGRWDGVREVFEL